jgi:hypothetical protein
MPRCRRRSLPRARSRLLRCDVLRRPRPSVFSLFREPPCVHGYAPGSSQDEWKCNTVYIDLGTHAVDRGYVGHGGIVVGIGGGRGKCMGE